MTSAERRRQLIVILEEAMGPAPTWARFRRDEFADRIEVLFEGEREKPNETGIVGER